MIKELKQFVDRLQSTSSRNEKEEILRSATEDQKKVLEFLFNPYKITGISKKKIEKFKGTVNQVDEMSLFALLRHLETHNTGRDLDVEYALEVAYSTPYPELVLSIVRKDLTLGVNVTTLNKVFGKGFIPTFGVQLAEKYFDDPDKLVPEGTEFTLTEKFDGVRCVLMFEGKNPLFYTRSGKRIEGLTELEEETRVLDKNFVYDGELLKEGEGKSNNLYRETMSIVGSDKEKKGVRFNVFDCIEKDKFKEGMDSAPYIQRRQRLHESGIEELIHTAEVPILYRGTDRSEILKWLAWAKESGKEGVMININNVPYICDRTPYLLKVKTFNECEAVVRSIEKGTGKNAQRLGAVFVEIKDKTGKLHGVRVGSGFTDKDRDYYFKHQKELLGKVVEIGYFEVTNNQADDSLSLRFPIWTNRIRDLDKTEENMSPIN